MIYNSRSIYDKTHGGVGGSRTETETGMGHAKRQAVVSFLEDFKRAMAEFGLQVISRSTNIATLRELGLSKKNQEDIIFSLTPANYNKGPEPDRDREGEFWFFGIKEKGKLLYIKLKLVSTGGIAYAKCVSFHFAGFSMEFPFEE